MSLTLAIGTPDHHVKLSRLPPGAAGTDATVAAMWGLIQRDATNHNVQDLARRWLSLGALYQGMRQYITFERDPRGVELLYPPASSAKDVNIAIGVTRDLCYSGQCARVTMDCDDATMLACAVIAAWQQPHIRPAIMVVGIEFANFAHVLPVALARRTAGVRGQAIGGDGMGMPVWDIVLPFDPQENRPPGHTPPEPYRRLYTATGEHAP